MFSSSRSSSTPQDGDPFRAILSTPALKQEFTLLVLLCTNHMRTRLASTFSASHTSSGGRPSIALRGDGSTLPPSYNEATNGRGRQDYDRRDEELSSSGVQELRRQALTAMNSWRTKVLRRVGEALNVRSDAVLAEKARRDAINGEDNDSLDKHNIYLKVATSLTKLQRKDRETLLSSLLLLLLSLETYSAYSRVLLCHVCNSLDLPQDVLTTQEATTAKGLLTAAENMNAEQETAAAANSNAAGRAWKVGLATVAGAALIGITGGLAAPFLAAGVGTIFGAIGLGGTAAAGLLGGLAGNVVLIGGLFGAYGGRMTGGLMDKYSAEISDFAFIPVTKPDEDRQHHLRVGITISGWLTEESEVVNPWTVIPSHTMESFALRWELSLLLELGTKLAAIAKSYAWGFATTELLKRTILSSLAVGLMPLALVRVASVAENPFSISLVRADKAGELLADALINRAQGERPVNLFGYSMGARVIYSCLQSLARRKAFGLVESAVLIAAPCPSDAADWRIIRSVCVGRVVNVYSTNDFILAFLYRTSSMQFGVAGVEAIEEVAGVESWDVSVLVSGHIRYRHLIGKVLKEIGIEGLDEDEILRQTERLKAIDEKEARDKEAAAMKRSRKANQQSKQGDLIDFGDDPTDGLVNEKDSAHPLSDGDIEQELKYMQLQDIDSNRRDPLEENLPALPPRRQAVLAATTKPEITKSQTKQSHRREPSIPSTELQSLAPEPIAISDDEEQTTSYGNKTNTTRSPVREEDSDDEDDPFASRGIMMIDAEDEEAAEREAERIERNVRKQLEGLHIERRDHKA